MCEYDGMQTTLCDNVEAYAQACQSSGVTISWRNTTFCRKLQLLTLWMKSSSSFTLVILYSLSSALPCPLNSHYSDCSAPCPPTCSNLFPMSCHLPPTACVEGCQCDAGFVLSDSKCVRLDQCGCLDSDGEYHDVSEAGSLLLLTRCDIILQDILNMEIRSTCSL